MFQQKLESLIYETRLISLFGRIIDGGQLANVVEDTTDNYQITDNCTKSNWKPVYQYSMNGDYINEYPCVKKAGEIINCCASQISNAAKKQKFSAKGFQWRYYKVDKIESMNPQKKIIYQFDLDGNFIREWESIISASKGLKMSPANIECVLMNRSVSAGNFLWSFDNKQISIKEKYKFRNKYKKPVYQYDKNYNLINVFCGITEAANHTNAHTGNISACCLKKKGKNTSKGFIWSYEPLTR